MDFLGIAISELANISERRIDKLMNPALSGHPAFLATDEGLNSGLMILQVADRNGNKITNKRGEEIGEMFNKLSKEGKTIILVTHDMYIAKYADRNRKIFVFAHMLSVMPADYATDSSEEMQTLINIVSHYHVDYVVTAHNYAYARTEKGGTTYLASAPGSTVHEPVSTSQYAPSPRLSPFSSIPP